MKAVDPTSLHSPPSLHLLQTPPALSNTFKTPSKHLQSALHAPSPTKQTSTSRLLEIHTLAAGEAGAGTSRVVVGHDRVQERGFGVEGEEKREASRERG